MEADEIIRTIGNAKGLAQNNQLNQAMKEIVLKVANLAESQLNAVHLSANNEAERAVTLESLEKNFAEVSHTDMLIHLNKVNEALSEIVRAAIRLDNTRIATEQLINAEAEVTDADMELQAEKEAEAIDQLIAIIKAIHNAAPELAEEPEKDPENFGDVKEEDDQGEDAPDLTATEKEGSEANEDSPAETPQN